MDIHPFTTFIVRRVQWRLERHDLKFPAPKESFDLGRDMVFFYGRDGETWVRCAISREALDDHFHGDEIGRSTRLNSSHRCISYAVFCLKQKHDKTLHISRA